MGRGGRIRDPDRRIPALTRIAVVASALALAACAGALQWEKGTHTVRRGETLYGIAWQHGLDHRKLARWNDLDDPSLIHPGQRLRLTPPDGRSPGAGASRTADRASVPEPSGRRDGGPTQRAQGRDRGAADESPRTRSSGAGGEIDWQWPVRGAVVSAFGEGGKRAEKGIDIAGEAGDPVSASAPGRVVYSGSGLIGYGRLIIIKHTEEYLSAYGHNRKAYVAEGDDISAGQKIAEMGRSDDGRTALHFEIRIRGDPVDPLPLLPDG